MILKLTTQHTLKLPVLPTLLVGHEKHPLCVPWNTHARLEPGCRGDIFFGFSAAVNMRRDREEKRLIGEE